MVRHPHQTHIRDPPKDVQPRVRTTRRGATRTADSRSPGSTWTFVQLDIWPIKIRQAGPTVRINATDGSRADRAVCLSPLRSGRRPRGREPRRFRLRPGNGSASAELTVPEGAKRFLAVGVSTLESATVTGVTYGAAGAHAPDRSPPRTPRAPRCGRSRLPTSGTANVTVTLSNGRAGRHRRHQLRRRRPVRSRSSAPTRRTPNNASNSASLVLNGTVEADGMFGVLTVNDAANIDRAQHARPRPTRSSPTAWNLEQGTVVGARRDPPRPHGHEHGAQLGHQLGLDARSTRPT